MASISQLFDALRLDLKGYFAGIIPAPIPMPEIQIDNPSTTQLANLARGGATVISIFDVPKMSRNVTRWNIQNQTLTDYPTGITTVATPPNANIPIPARITIGGSPNPNDALSACFVSNRNKGFVIYEPVSTDTPTTIATALSALINANVHCSALVLATPSANVINLVPVDSTKPLSVVSVAGNIATRQMETGRQIRTVQLSVYSTKYDDRATIGTIVLGYLNLRCQQLGIQIPQDSTWVRMIPRGDAMEVDTKMVDIYCWHFLVECEVAITALERLYSVLAIDASLTVGY